MSPCPQPIGLPSCDAFFNTVFKYSCSGHGGFHVFGKPVMLPSCDAFFNTVFKYLCSGHGGFHVFGKPVLLPSCDAFFNTVFKYSGSGHGVFHVFGKPVMLSVAMPSSTLCSNIHVQGTAGFMFLANRLCYRCRAPTMNLP